MIDTSPTYWAEKVGLQRFAGGGYFFIPPKEAFHANQLFPKQLKCIKAHFIAGPGEITIQLEYQLNWRICKTIPGGKNAFTPYELLKKAEEFYEEIDSFLQG